MNDIMPMMHNIGRIVGKFVTNKYSKTPMPANNPALSLFEADNIHVGILYELFS